MAQLVTINVAQLVAIKMAKRGPVSNFTAYIYIYIHIYIHMYVLWSYYLGHVLGFLMVTNWATFAFLKRLFVKRHYKNRGFSNFLFFKKRDPKFLIVTNWATLPILKWHKRGPASNY